MGESLNFPFPKSSRILSRQQFLEIQQQGRKCHFSSFLVIYLPNSAGTRIGFTASKKTGKAWFRNRLRRLMRESIRRILLPEQLPFDLVLIAKKDLPHDLKQENVDQDVLRLLTVLKKLTQKTNEMEKKDRVE